MSAGIAWFAFVVLVLESTASSGFPLMDMGKACPRLFRATNDHFMTPESAVEIIFEGSEA